MKMRKVLREVIIIISVILLIAGVAYASGMFTKTIPASFTIVPGGQAQNPNLAFYSDPSGATLVTSVSFGTALSNGAGVYNKTIYVKNVGNVDYASVVVPAVTVTGVGNISSPGITTLTQNTTVEPVVVAKTEKTVVEKPVYIVVEQPVIQEVIKEVPVEKIVIQQVPIPLKEWQSLDEFLGMMPSVTTFKANSCLWVAETIQQSLMSQGYPVSVALVWDGYYYGTVVKSRDYSEKPYGHAGLLVDIQDSWYFYDPESKAVTKLF